MKIIFVVFIFVAVAAHADAKKKCFPLPSCGHHEVKSDCGANECQATCANPNLANVCQAECKAGCVCEPNYLRTPEGKCVRLEDCPQLFKCGHDEVYEKCSTSCGDPTCGNRDGFFCGGGCSPKCVCKPDHVRDANNKCVHVKSCPAPEVLPEPAPGPDPLPEVLPEPVNGNENSMTA